MIKSLLLNDWFILVLILINVGILFATPLPRESSSEVYKYNHQPLDKQ